MKRILVIVILGLFVVPAFGERQKGMLVRLKGWIVDSRCGAKNAAADRAEDTLACHKAGAKLVFLASDGTTYDIDDQERAAEHVGQEIGIFGTVSGTRNLKVGRYTGREDKKQQDRGGIGPVGHGGKPVKKD